MSTKRWFSLAKIMLALGGIILILSLLWIIFDNHIFVLFSKIDSSKASQLGDYLNGFVGIFWSGAGLILIFVTIQEQRHQNDKIQFESSFFNLISNFNNIISQTDGIVVINNEPLTCSGHKYFSNVMKSFKGSIQTQDFYKFIVTRNEVPEIKSFLADLEKKCGGEGIKTRPEHAIHDYALRFILGEQSKEFGIARFEFFYEKYQDKLSHYYRFLFNMVSFVVQEREQYSDIKRYLDLIQAQMSNDELGLLFYFALSKHSQFNDNNKLYYWLNQYDFLENIDSEALLKRSHNIYYKSIFKFLTADEINVKKSEIKKEILV